MSRMLSLGRLTSSCLSHQIWRCCLDEFLLLCFCTKLQKQQWWMFSSAIMLPHTPPHVKVCPVYPWRRVDTLDAGPLVSSDSASTRRWRGSRTCGQRWCHTAGRVLERNRFINSGPEIKQGLWQVVVLNPGQTFATRVTTVDQCLRIPHHCLGFIALDFYCSLCPQCSPQPNFQMYKAAVSPQEKIANLPNISVIWHQMVQISNKLKSKTSQLKSKHSI